MMDSDILSKICSQVYSRFPEVNGAHPKVQSQSKSGASNYLLIFTGSAKSSSGTVLSRVVRVVASENGKIIKITTSK
jgi:hypothetical protein